MFSKLQKYVLLASFLYKNGNFLKFPTKFLRPTISNRPVNKISVEEAICFNANRRHTAVKPLKYGCKERVCSQIKKKTSRNNTKNAQFFQQFNKLLHFKSNVNEFLCLKCQSKIETTTTATTKDELTQA